MNKFEIGTAITFRYLNTKNPDKLRLCKVLEVKPTKVLCIDLDTDTYKTFLKNMMKDVTIVAGAAKQYQKTETDIANSVCVSNVSYIITNSGTITLNIDSSIYTIDTSHINYKKIIDILRSTNYNLMGEQLKILVDVSTALTKYTHNSDTISTQDVVISNGEIKYKGSVLHNVLVERILECQENNLPFKPILNFLTKLMSNPSFRAVEELYTFLEHKNIPITPDGCFLGYKKVREDYLDYFTATIDNSVGKLISMERNGVNDDCDIGCSKGYHVGSLQYANCDFHPGEGHLMIVKVNPADVVSVPKDCSCQKVRVCKYQVFGEYITDLPNTVYGD